MPESVIQTHPRFPTKRRQARSKVSTGPLQQRNSLTTEHSHPVASSPQPRSQSHTWHCSDRARLKEVEARPYLPQYSKIPSSATPARPISLSNRRPRCAATLIQRPPTRPRPQDPERSSFKSPAHAIQLPLLAVCHYGAPTGSPA